MEALHEALQTLSPIDFSSIPTDDSALCDFLRNAFAQCQIVVDSVPPPPPPPSTLPSHSRSRSETSPASSIADIRPSSARLDIPCDEALLKPWGKPMKLSAKENPMGMSVYKLGSKDGKGAWFARRSVHEGLGFVRWKKGLEKELLESLKVEGGPGAGSVRGVGGDRLVENRAIEGTGKMEVYHLSAQFPGPSAPRDFVELLLSSSSDTSARGMESTTQGRPRQYMVVSKPCQHPECPPKTGFVRGQYESVEFIREIPVKSKKSMSTTDLPSLGYNASSLSKRAITNNAKQRFESETPDQAGNETDLRSKEHQGKLSAEDVEAVVEGTRARGKTISFAGSRGSAAKGEAMDLPVDDDDEINPNPVEWIMITRSDPGGSVPRFLVERGTPSAIINDASKFLDWACKKDHSADDEADGHGPGSTKQTDSDSQGSIAEPAAGAVQQPFADESSKANQVGRSDFLSKISDAAYAGIKAHAPQAVIDRLTTDDDSPAATATSTRRSSTSSGLSFASAEDWPSSPASKSVDNMSTASPVKSTYRDKELAKLAVRKAKLDLKLQSVREKELKDPKAVTEKQKSRVKRAEERHAKEVAKAEESFEREVKKLDERREREIRRAEEKRAREEEKKSHAPRKEKDEVQGLKAEIDRLQDTVSRLQEQVRILQSENTAMVTGLGRTEQGRNLLLDLKKGGSL